MHSDWLNGAGGHTIGDLYILYTFCVRAKTTTKKKKMKKSGDKQEKRPTRTKWNEANLNVKLWSLYLFKNKIVNTVSTYARTSFIVEQCAYSCVITSLSSVGFVLILLPLIFLNVVVYDVQYNAIQVFPSLSLSHFGYHFTISLNAMAMAMEISFLITFLSPSLLLRAHHSLYRSTWLFYFCRHFLSSTFYASHLNAICVL